MAGGLLQYRARLARRQVKLLFMLSSLFVVMGWLLLVGPDGVTSPDRTVTGSRSLLSVDRYAGDKLTTNGSTDWDHVDCGHFSSVPDACLLVEKAANCQQEGGFVNYLQLPYCVLYNVPGAVVVLLLWLVFLFVALGNCAEDFFCPALSVISDTLRLSHNVAGVTFLALGNGAPDMFSMYSSIMNATERARGTSLALGALFGAGCFVTTVVVGTVAMVVPYRLTRRPFLRDITVYLVAVLWTYVVLWDRQIHLYESLGFIVIYVVYVAVVIVGRKIYQSRKKQVIDPLVERRAEARSVELNPSLRSPLLIQAPPSPRPSSQPFPRVQGSLVTGALDFSDTLAVAPLGSVSLNTALHHTQITQATRQESHNNDDVEMLDEQSPLLPTGRAVRPAAGPWMLLAGALVPINLKEFSELSIASKLYTVIATPVNFLLTITVPVVDFDEEDQKWNKYLQALQCVMSPLFFAFGANVWAIELGGIYPLWLLALIIGLLLASFVMLVTGASQPPRFHSAFAFMGFFVAVVWIYVIANEIVNLLQTLGRIMTISDTILGLTVLAWGNSIGDFVSNLTVAKAGFPQMAVGACFGGPALNVLLGMGVSCTAACLTKVNPYPVAGELGLEVSGGFLLVSLLSSIIIIPCNQFSAGKKYGIYLCSLYAIFMVTSVTLEFVA